MLFIVAGNELVSMLLNFNSLSPTKRLNRLECLVPSNNHSSPFDPFMSNEQKCFLTLTSSMGDNKLKFFVAERDA
jgi:hypothetical protein